MNEREIEGRGERTSKRENDRQREIEIQGRGEKKSEYDKE